MTQPMQAVAAISSMSTPSPSQDIIKHCVEAASGIHAECSSILSGRGHNDEGRAVSTSGSLEGCGPALVELLSRQASIVHQMYQSCSGYEPVSAIKGKDHKDDRACQDLPRTQDRDKYDLALKRLEDIASIAYSKFYAFIFKDLPACWRQLYTDARILKFCLLWIKSPFMSGAACLTSSPEVIVDSPDALDEMIKTLDLALILAGAAGQRRGRRWVDRALDLLRLLWLERCGSRDKNSEALGNGSRPPAKRVKLSSENPIPPGTNAARLENMIFSTREPFTPPVTHPIRVTQAQALSMEAFQTYMDSPRDAKLGPEPLVIRGALEDWPALSTRPWNRPAYLLSQTLDGRRLVPVEIGRSYVDEGWGQKLVTFGEFLREYIDPSLVLLMSKKTTQDPDVREASESDHGRPQKKSEDLDEASSQRTKPVAYLAQHQLFTQLPNLRNDILVPDYCYTTPPPHPFPPSASSSSSDPDPPEELDEPLLNAWFGPPGTISPLHHDPYHNILAQVVGRKYVRLYSPLETGRLVPRGRENGVEMGNTSLFDVGVLEGWDAPDSSSCGSGGEGGGEEEEGGGDQFRDIPFVDCILEPGDALYIPVGWWHYVRGLSVSFSVSFWWN